MPTIFDLQSTDDPRDVVHRTVQALVEGHVVGVPTETTYILAAHALNSGAVERLCELIGEVPPDGERNNPVTNNGHGNNGHGNNGHENNGHQNNGEGTSDRGSLSERLVISVRSREAAGDFFCQISPLARRLSYRCWPGPLTLVVPCTDQHSAIRQLPEPVRRRIVADDAWVGFRVVDHRILSYIHRFLSAPLVLASANRSGEPAPTTAEAVAASFGRDLPLLLDDGPTRYGGEATVARVAGNRWKVLREGVIERAAMNQFVKPVIALVCTGNTCRSPMAETLLRERLRKKFGSEDTVRVLSAGLAAGAGSGAAPQAIEVMGHRGLDLTGHCSRPLDESVMNVADLVLTMTRGHRAAILAAWPNMHDRVFTLRRDDADITDPVGMTVDVYQRCAEQIDAELAKWIEALEDDFFPQSEEGQ